MGTRDLTYLISFDVQDAQQVADASENVEDLAAAVGDLDEKTPEGGVDLGFENIEELPGQIGAVGDELDDLPLDETNTKAGGLGDMMDILGLAVVGVGAAVVGVTGAIEVGRRAWDWLTADAQAAAARTRELSDALLEASGALAAIEGSVAGSGDPFNAFAQAFLELDNVDIGTISAAMGNLGLDVADLGSTLLMFQGDDVARQFYAMADAAGLSAEGFLLADMNGTLLANTTGNATAAQREFAESWNGLAVSMSSGVLDLEEVARRQLDVAEGFDAMGVAAARAALAPDASEVDVWMEYQRQLAAAAEEADALAESEAALAEQQARTAAGARELGLALGSIEWGDAVIAGATTAMSGFTTELFSAGNQLQASEDAYRTFFDAVGEGSLNLDVATEAGAKQQDALEGIARTLESDFVQAYDLANGSQEMFVAYATKIGEDTLTRLQEQLNLTDDDVNVLRESLGLTAGDYEARFHLAADEVAMQRLALLQGAITNLPESVQTEVAVAISAGDPQEALDTIVGYYADPPTPPTVTVATDADTTGADEALAEVEARETTAVVDIDGDDTPADRVFSSLGERIRATILNTYLGIANAEDYRDAVDDLTATRTLLVDVVLDSVPTAAQIVSRITGGSGRISIPVDAYVRHTPRIDGTRMMAG